MAEDKERNDFIRKMGEEGHRLNRDGLENFYGHYSSLAKSFRSGRGNMTGVQFLANSLLDLGVTEEHELTDLFEQAEDVYSAHHKVPHATQVTQSRKKNPRMRNQ